MCTLFEWKMKIKTKWAGSLFKFQPTNTISVSLSVSVCLSDKHIHIEIRDECRRFVNSLTLSHLLSLSLSLSLCLSVCLTLSVSFFISFSLPFSLFLSPLFFFCRVPSFHDCIHTPSSIHICSISNYALAVFISNIDTFPISISDLCCSLFCELRSWIRIYTLNLVHSLCVSVLLHPLYCSLSHSIYMFCISLSRCKNFSPSFNLCRLSPLFECWLLFACVFAAVKVFVRFRPPLRNARAEKLEAAAEEKSTYLFHCLSFQMHFILSYIWLTANRERCGQAITC